LVNFDLDDDIVEEEVVSNDLKGETAFRFDDRVDTLKTFLGEAIDNDVLPIIKSGSL
jgi:hypothetical protein